MGCTLAERRCSSGFLLVEVANCYSTGRWSGQVVDTAVREGDIDSGRDQMLEELLPEQ